MNAAAESYPPPAREEALGAAEDAGTLDRLQLLGPAVRLFSHVPTVAKAGTKLAGELARVALGRSDVEAERRAWRFKDPTWTGNSGYRWLMQGYLATCQALGELAVQADLPDWRQREQARFLVTMLTSALAPTNTLLGNPAPGLTVSKSSGDGRQRGHTEAYRGAEYTVELLLKVRPEVLVDGVDRRGRLAEVTVWLIDKSRSVGVVSGVLMQQPAGTGVAARRAAPS